VSEPTAGLAAPLAVIGIGNVLMRDDGAGIRVVEALGRLASDDPALLPPSTRLIDGGTHGADLAWRLDGVRAVVLVDAMVTGAVPGTVAVWQGDELGTNAPHGSAVAELLGAASLAGWLPAHVALVGIECAEVGVDAGLSPLVQSAVPRAVEAVRRTLARLEATMAAPTPTEVVAR
jgi:hydrogenase maturation protease